MFKLVKKKNYDTDKYKSLSYIDKSPDKSIYDKLFSRIKNNATDILEIGIIHKSNYTYYLIYS